jgi:hypothetical protein
MLRLKNPTTWADISIEENETIALEIQTIHSDKDPSSVVRALQIDVKSLLLLMYIPSAIISYLPIKI